MTFAIVDGDAEMINRRMRLSLLALLFGGGLVGLPVLAQEKAALTYDGVGGVTTPWFQVRDKWEVRWDSPEIISITILTPDGAVVAGASGSLKGSLYEPRGGRFVLQVARGNSTGTSPWHLSVVEIGEDAGGLATNAAENYIPPPINAVLAVITNTASAVPPMPVLPPTNTAPASAIHPGLTEAQAHAVVVIKGDAEEGTGFLVKTADGPAVVTNQHVLAANPNVRILTTTGAQVKTLGLKGASDRDLAMIAIQDDHYSYLELATDVQNTVQADDVVITPGNSEGGEVVLNTTGKILGIGPDRIEFDNPIYHGNSGGPVLHTKSGKVLAVVTQALRVNTASDIDKASFENKNSAITGAMRYFGLRLDTVPKWEDYDWNRFLSETTFLKNFHEVSRALDSLLNGAHYEKVHLATGTDDSPPNAQYYLRNAQIQTAHDNFHKMSTDSDNSQRLDAERELVMDLQGIADREMNVAQNAANFYGFDQLRAAQEIKYRKALRTEIDNFGGKISDLGH